MKKYIQPNLKVKKLAVETLLVSPSLNNQPGDGKQLGKQSAIYEDEAPAPKSVWE